MKIEINALYPNGELKTYEMPANEYAEKYEDIRFISEEEGILLQIYEVRSNGLKNKIYDSLFNQYSSRGCFDELSIMFA